MDGQPILHRGRVYAQNQSRAVCVYVGDPELLDRDLRASSTPAVNVPQPAYRDVAAMLLGFEPEYAFDVPGSRWLMEWFFVAWPGIFGVSWLVALLCHWLLPRRVGRQGSRRIFWSNRVHLGSHRDHCLEPMEK